jgi:GNAT superfamily N-acetyltransferase
MTQPAVPDSADWQRGWTIEARSVTLQPVTRRVAQAVLDGGPITRSFEEGSLHDRIPQAMGFAIRHIDSGAAAVLPTVWLIVRRADGRIIGDLGTHGLPDSEGCVEIGYTLAPSARGQGIGTAAVAALDRPPGGGAGDPPAYRGHRRSEHGVSAPARTAGIPHRGSACGHRRGALHTHPQLAGHAIAIAGADVRSGLDRGHRDGDVAAACGMLSCLPFRAGRPPCRRRLARAARPAGGTAG